MANLTAKDKWIARLTEALADASFVKLTLSGPRGVGMSEFSKINTDAIYLAPSLKRLGELYEAKGDKDNAIKQYTRFVELWKGADPELQPQVAEVRERLRKLTPVERPR